MDRVGHILTIKNILHTRPGNQIQFVMTFYIFHFVKVYELISMHIDRTVVYDE